MLIALNLQAFIQFRQPEHLLSLYISTFSKIRVPAMYRNDLSNTLPGQALRHSQQAVQDSVFNLTNVVWVPLFFESMDFMLIVIKFIFEMTSFQLNLYFVYK